MSFTYTHDPGNSKLDWIRFHIGDTTESSMILTDAEINYIVENYRSDTSRLAAAFRQCATYYAARMAKRKLGPQSEDTTDRQAYYARMADLYEGKLGFTGTPPMPEYSSEKIFDINMMENTE